MNNLGKLLLTNWVHILGFYICIEISSILQVIFYNESGSSFMGTLFSLSLAVPFLMFTYGLMFIIAFLGAIILLDLALFPIVKYGPFSIMLIEWLLIVPIFIYWAFEYEYWLWLELCGVFLLTQYIKSKKIEKFVKA
jgi:hypothetical protein